MTSAAAIGIALWHLLGSSPVTVATPFECLKNLKLDDLVAKAAMLPSEATRPEVGIASTSTTTAGSVVVTAIADTKIAVPEAGRLSFRRLFCQGLETSIPKACGPATSLEPATIVRGPTPDLIMCSFDLSSAGKTESLHAFAIPQPDDSWYVLILATAHVADATR
jgi:hypothetical protein